MIQFAFAVSAFAAPSASMSISETLRLMPRRFRNKAQIELAIGAEQSAPMTGRILRRTPTDACFRVLCAGRFIDCKRMHLAPVSRGSSIPIPTRLTMVGEGPAGGALAQACGESGNRGERRMAALAGPHSDGDPLCGSRRSAISGHA
jgi:hypothetical protein